MENLLFSIFGFIAAIGILVTVHECGHFLAARLCNVKVIRFSVGFGRPMWTKVSGVDQTQYTIGLIPLGGYVKMLDEDEGEVEADEKSRAFNNQSLPKRAFIVVAGPLANFLFAVCAYAFVNMIGQQGISPIIESVKQGSYAAQAGFEVGDKILSVDGKTHRHWDDNRIYFYNAALSKKRVNFEVESLSGNISTRSIDLSQVENWQPSQALLETTLGLYPFNTQLDIVVGIIAENSPAQAAGLRVDDRIVSINGQLINDWSDLIAYVSTRPDQQVTMLVERGNSQQLSLAVFIEARQVDSEIIGRIGIGNKPVLIPEHKLIDVNYAFLAAINKGVNDTWQMSVVSLRMLWKMLKLEISPKNISGPITIAEYAGKTAQVGFNSFILFLAVISISLGIINLMPIPMLDGGHLLMYFVEAIKGEPLSETLMALGQKIGVLILGALMFLAFYNDLVRLLQ